MIDVKIIASGSDGNCAALTSDGVTVLFDAGIKFGKIQQALNFNNPAAIFLTHEHCDHAHIRTLNEYLKRGVDVYLTRGTAEKLNLENSHHLKIIVPKVMYDLDNAKHVHFYASPAFHDAAEPVSYTIQFDTENAQYIVDTGEIPHSNEALPHYLLIEANYSEERISDSGVDENQKQRIMGNHLSIEQVIDFLERNSGRLNREIYLLHLSKRHGNPQEFQRRVRAIVPENVRVYAAGGD